MCSNHKTRLLGAVPGGKKIWRIAILANPANSLAYWAFGRR
jgi:hypothetical protein